MIQIKIENGTLNSTPVCYSCANSQIMTDRHGQERFYCNEIREYVVPPVKCTKWESRGEYVATYQIRNVATVISPRNDGGFLFRSPSGQCRAFDSKGKEYEVDEKGCRVNGNLKVSTRRRK